MPKVTIIDGRSGSGKTTLAEQLAEHSGAQILRLDELYPGWNGLAQGSASVARALERGNFERYDWEAGVFSDRVTLDSNRPLIIEGCGSLTRANRDSARAWAGESAHVHSIWLACDSALRRERALARDGEMFRPHWEHWARQEDAHFAKAQPIALAREIIHVD